MDHVSQFIQLLQQPKALAAMEFSLPLLGSSDDDVALSLGVEDEWAALVAEWQFTMAFLRIKRGLWLLRGWPWSLVSVLHPDHEVAQNTIERFKKDFDAWTRVKRFHETCPEVDEVLSRHCFEETSNKQLHLLLEQGQWKASQALKDHIRNRFSGLAATQLVEDAFGEMKNAKILKGGPRFRKPERAMGVVLAKEVIQKRHKFDPVPSGSFAAGLANKLPKDAFRAPSDSWSDHWGSIASTHSSTEWYSPGATSWCTPVADLICLQHVDAIKDTNTLRYAWQGSLFQFSHGFVFKNVGSGQPQEQWYVPGLHMSDSCIICWPMAKKATSAGDIYFEPMNITEPCLLPPPNLLSKGVVTMPVSWLSWGHQWHKFADAKGILSPQIRCFASGPEQSLLDIATRNAWWGAWHVSVEMGLWESRCSAPILPKKGGRFRIPRQKILALVISFLRLESLGF